MPWLGWPIVTVPGVGSATAIPEPQRCKLQVLGGAGVMLVQAGQLAAKSRMLLAGGAWNKGKGPPWAPARCRRWCIVAVCGVAPGAPSVRRHGAEAAEPLPDVGLCNRYTGRSLRSCTPPPCQC